MDLLDNGEENTRKAAAKTLAAYSKIAPADQLDTFFTTHLAGDASSWQRRQGQSTAITQLLNQKPELATKHYKAITTKLSQDIKDEKSGAREGAAEILGLLLVAAPAKAGELVPSLSLLINDPTTDVALAGLRATKQFAKAHPDVIARHLVAVVPLVVARLKDKVLPVKIEAERVLLHALQVHTNPQVFQEYVATTDPVFNKYITDYVTRVIKKLSAKSDDEKDEDED